MEITLFTGYKLPVRQDKKLMSLKEGYLAMIEKKVRRSILLLLIAAAMIFLYTGCASIKEKLGVAFPAKQYVEGMLEAVYHGEYENYQKYTQESKEAAASYHEQYVEGEASYFAEYLHIEELSKKGEEQLKTLIEELYKQARFEVQEPIHNDEGQLLEVVVYPVDFFHNAGEELNEYIKNFNQALAGGEYDTLSSEEQKAKYEAELLEICEKYKEIPASTYQVSVNLTLKELDGGYYQITGGFEKLDETVIPY